MGKFFARIIQRIKNLIVDWESDELGYSRFFLSIIICAMSESRGADAVTRGDKYKRKSEVITFYLIHDTRWWHGPIQLTVSKGRAKAQRPTDVLTFSNLDFKQKVSNVVIFDPREIKTGIGHSDINIFCKYLYHTVTLEFRSSFIYFHFSLQL